MLREFLSIEFKLSHSDIPFSIGILGMGSIGGIVARHMQAFGAKVIYHNRNKLPEKCEHNVLSGRRIHLRC